MRMKAAITLLLHLGVLLCLSGTGWVQGQIQGKFLWDPTTAHTLPRAEVITEPARTSIADLWSQLIGRLETRNDALQSGINNLEARNTALQRDLFFLRAENAQARGGMEASFNHSLDGLQNNLNRVWTWLNDDRASRSIFSGGLTNSERFTCEGPNDTVVSVLYRAVFINLGGDYSESTGVFTVRLPGVYVMALTVYSNTGEPFAAMSLCATLNVNGDMLVKLTEKYRQDQEDSATAVVSQQLFAGDMVEVSLPIGCKMCDDNSHRNTFNIFLLYATD